MWILWTVCAVLLVIAVVILSRPLFRKYSQAELAQKQEAANRRKKLNIELYEQKKAQIELDFANGLLDEEARIEAQNEVEHSLLHDASVAHDTELVQLDNALAKKLALSFLIFIPLFSILTYAFIMPDNLETVVMNEVPAVPGGQKKVPDIGAMVASLENKMTKNPDNIQGWTMLGRSYVVMKRYPEAVTAYEKALELTLKNGQVEGKADLKIDLVEVLLQVGGEQNYEKARKLLADLLNADPNNADALWFMGFLDYQLGNKEQTVKRWKYLLGMLPPDGEQAQIVRSYMAQVNSELPDDSKIKQQAQKLLDQTQQASAQASSSPIQSEQQPSAQVQKPAGPAPGQQMTGSKDEQAFIASMVARVEARVKANPQDLKGWKTLGKSYGVLGRYTDSADAYGKATAIDSSDVNLLINYAQAVIKANDEQQYRQARSFFDNMLAKNPDNVDVLFLSGLMARAAGDKATAQQHWTKLLPLLPADSPAAKNVEQYLREL